MAQPDISKRGHGAREGPTFHHERGVIDVHDVCGAKWAPAREKGAHLTNLGASLMLMTCQSSSPPESVCQSSSPPESVCQSSSHPKSVVCQSSSPPESVVCQSSSPPESVVCSVVCQSSSPPESVVCQSSPARPVLCWPGREGVCRRLVRLPRRRSWAAGGDAPMTCCRHGWPTVIPPPPPAAPPRPRPRPPPEVRSRRAAFSAAELLSRSASRGSAGCARLPRWPGAVEWVERWWT